MYREIRQLIFGMTSPFTLQDVFFVMDKHGFSEKTKILEVLSELCSSGVLLCKDGMFYRSSLRCAV